MQIEITCISQQLACATITGRGRKYSYICFDKVIIALNLLSWRRFAKALINDCSFLDQKFLFHAQLA